jgi:hypothetical protein
LPRRRKIEELPPPAGPPREADGVVYSAIESAPGLKFFRCDAYHATLSMAGCASRWVQAQTATGEAADRYAACRGCPIGAPHAGYAPVRYSTWYGVDICPRCSKGTTRMIGNRVCVSCYNRQREMKAGKNARGNRPIELLERPVHKLEVMVEVDGIARRFLDPATCSLTETVLRISRTTKGEIAFGWAGGGMAPLEVDPFEPANDLATEADQVTVEEAGADGWHLTDFRCRPCRGTMLRSVRSPAICRCADCGRQRPAEPELVAESNRTAAAVAPDGSGVHRKIERHRALLFGTSALVPGRWR